VKDYIESNVVKIETEDQKLNEADQIESMKGETVRVLNCSRKPGFRPPKMASQYVASTITL
jgi:hypothetical protein